MNLMLMGLLFAFWSRVGLWAAGVGEVDELGAWKPLFDGKTLDGWNMSGPVGSRSRMACSRLMAAWAIVVYQTEARELPAQVVYKTEAKESNSGVFIRIADRPVDPWYAVHHGYEIQICDVGDEWHTTGCLYSLTKAKSRPGLPPGEWNTMVATLEGPRVKIAINGSEVTEFDSETSAVPERVKDYEPERGLG